MNVAQKASGSHDRPKRIDFNAISAEATPSLPAVVTYLKQQVRERMIGGPRGLRQRSDQHRRRRWGA